MQHEKEDQPRIFKLYDDQLGLYESFKQLKIRL